MTTKKHQVDWRVLCVGLVCLTAAEITALLLGYNGTLFKVFIVLVSLILGVTIPLDKFVKH